MWEALEKMSIVKEKMEKWHGERRKEEFKTVLIKAIHNNDSQETIDTLIEGGNFSKDELEEIYREAQKHK